MNIPGRVEDEDDRGVCSDRIGGKDAGLSQTVERDNADVWRNSYYDDYSDALVTVEKRIEGNVDRRTIILKLVLDGALPQSFLVEDLP